MAEHNDTGKKGEELAKNYLAERGYTILHTNWRYRHLEIDIIATRNNYLHFIEVKTRTTLYRGLPEEKVSRGKLKNLQSAADQYLYLTNNKKRVQFDTLAIVITPQNVQYDLIEDTYVW